MTVTPRRDRVIRVKGRPVLVSVENCVEIVAPKKAKQIRTVDDRVVSNVRFDKRREQDRVVMEEGDA
mgnify:CR=1 FL=1